MTEATRTLTTDQLPSLDVRQFWRELRPQWKPDILNRAPIRLSDGTTYANGFFPKGPRPTKAIMGVTRGTLRLEWTQAGFNGFRIWVLCPKCSTRVAVLYLHKNHLHCRECLGLRYTSQQKRPRPLDDSAQLKKSPNANDCGGSPAPTNAPEARPVPPIKRAEVREATPMTAYKREETIAAPVSEWARTTDRNEATAAKDIAERQKKAMGRFLRGWIGSKPSDAPLELGK